MNNIICFQANVLRCDGMELGDYTKSAIVTISGFVLFFMGILLPLMEGFELIPLFVLFVLTVAIGFHNKTPLGGLFYGLFTSICFVIGNLLTVVFIEYSLIVSNVITDQGFTVFLTVASVLVPEFVSVVLGFGSLGLFFGLLGYVYHRASAETMKYPPIYYRDYWSSIHSLGKSRRREYSEFDRRFATSSLKLTGLWTRIVSSIKLPSLDLAFVPSKKQEGKGDLYDLSTGQLLGTHLVNPAKLISRYRPFILKVPEYSTSVKGVRRVVFEELLEKFLGRVLKTRIVLPFFAFLSAVFVFSVFFTQDPSTVIGSNIGLSTFVAFCFASVSFIFVWRWSIKSKELFERSPDERVLILIVYVVLCFLFGFFYEMMLFNFPADSGGGVEVGFICARWFIPLSFVLGLGYIFIHREVEVVNTYFYDNTKTRSKTETSPVYKDPVDEPFWLKNEPAKCFWVIRFMYFWRFEITTMPHSDWERVELWIDAETGRLEWVVSDYHYRELWYEVKTDLPTLYVSFFVNFHTPIPVLDEKEILGIKKALEKSNTELLRTLINGESEEILAHLKLVLDNKVWKSLHPPHWISKYGLQNVAAAFSSSIPWRYWRYPKGLEKPELYLSQPAATVEDEPNSD